MLYQNCRELPIHNFFEINRTNDLKLLVKSGRKPSYEKLQEQWIDIMDEYNSYFSDKQKNQEQIKKNRLIISTLKLMNLESLKFIISTSKITDEVLTAAKKLKIKIENIDSYITGLKNEIKKLEKELENSDNEEEKDSNSLEKMLILVKENGFSFDRFSTPIIEFVFAINRMEEKVKYYESQKKKR